LIDGQILDRRGPGRTGGKGGQGVGALVAVDD
jgi:hypothetical protein